MFKKFKRSHASRTDPKIKLLKSKLMAIKLHSNEDLFRRFSLPAVVESDAVFN